MIHNSVLKMSSYHTLTEKTLEFITVFLKLCITDVPKTFNREWITP